jgi:hypothetical protein
MTATGTTAGMIDIAVNGLGPPLAEANMMIVVHPGLRLPGGRLTINGLQGTMITGAEAMMTAERLIIIMTAVGMIKIAAEMTEDATKKKNDTKTGHRGMSMAKDGRVERFLNEERVQENGWLPIVSFPSILDFLALVLSSFTRTVYFSYGWATSLGEPFGESAISVLGTRLGLPTFLVGG